MNVVVYSTPTCPYCYQVKDFLSQKGVKFTEYDVSTNRTAAEEMVRKSGQTGVPVITVGDQVIVGFDRSRLEQLLTSRNNGQRVRFGLQIADATRVAKTKGLTPVSGAFVGGVKPASPGEKAGIRKGDIITRFNSQSIRNAEDLENVLSQLARGSQAVITIMRGDRTIKSEIVI